MSTALPPDAAFDRACSLTIIERALTSLDHESEDPARFAALKP